MFIEFFMHIIHAKKINRNKCQFQCFVLFHRDTRAIEIMIRFDALSRIFTSLFTFEYLFLFPSASSKQFFFNLLRLKHFSV